MVLIVKAVHDSDGLVCFLFDDHHKTTGEDPVISSLDKMLAIEELCLGFPNHYFSIKAGQHFRRDDSSKFKCMC